MSFRLFSRCEAAQVQAQESPPTFSLTWTRGSSVLACLCLIAMVTAAVRDPREMSALLPQLWPALLVIVWLFVASFLISWAYDVEERFAIQAHKFCDVSEQR